MWIFIFGYIHVTNHILCIGKLGNYSNYTPSLPLSSCRDSLYIQQPTAMWSNPGGIPMEYSAYPHPPFTSPPATPMTPMTPVTPHPAAFTVQQYELPPAAPYHHK